MKKKVRISFIRQESGSVIAEVADESGIIETRSFGKFDECEYRRLLELISDEIPEATTIPIQLAKN